MTFMWVEPAGAASAVATAAIESGAAALVGDARALAALARIPVLRRDGDRLVGDGIDARMVRIRSPADQQAAKDALAEATHVVVETGDWRVIPLENLIAWAQGGGAAVVAVVASAAEARTALGSLERGVDGVLLRTADPAQVRETAQALARRAGSRVALEAAEVLSVAQVHMGDRVCVDTVAMLAPEEGLLVGSSAGLLFLVGSEAADSGYVAARPFRVNAGAVHGYALCPEGRTRYLSELRAGDEVLVVGSGGAARSVAVGRCKIEARPMLLVTARCGGTTGSVVVQNAETIRLLTPKGPRSVVALSAGDQVLVHRAGAARHFGVAIDERIQEV